MRWVFVASVVVGAFASPAMSQTPPAAGPIVERAVAGFVRPAYAEFHARAAALKQATEALCSSPSAGGLDLARRRFAETVAAWSAAEIIRFGPVTEENRLERVLFWPDRKGTGLRQVQQALAQRDPATIAMEALAGKSVAMQGLGALEFILFGTGAEVLATPADPYRCAYGHAIAANVEAIAGNVEAAWLVPDGIASVWAAPGPSNPLYRDDAEALGELLSVFVNGLELTRDVRLNGFLGDRPSADRPRQALFWRSGQTLAALDANLAGLAALFEASGIEAGLPENARWIAQSIRFEFANARSALAEQDQPVGDVLGEPEARARLDYLRVVTSSLSDLFGQRLAAEFGVSAGFSSLDGD